MKNVLKLLFCILSLSLMSACGDSGSKKWRLDNKELTQDELAKLKFAIVFKEKIEKENCWGNLSGENWVGLLFYFPEESKRCSQFNGWNKLGGSDWANLLSGETRFEKECDKFSGWKMMSNENWIELLSAQPKYMQKASEYKVWETFSNKDWIDAVKSKKNELIKKCDDLNGWEKFTNKDWKYIIKSKDSELLKKCDKVNGWKKLDIKDWEELLLSDISLSSNADKYDVWKSFSLSVWKKLIAKNEKFIEIAKNKKILDSIDNVTWIDLIISNPKLISIAQEKGVFKKFTPADWSNLISANPEYIDLMKKEASLDKLPNKELIKLYCLQPKLRNDIFSLNKIDVDVAKMVERIYKRFGENGSNLSPKELIVAVKIFPELKKQITEKTFERYDINSWCDILVGDKDIYEIISKKCAYLIPWKKFTFSDWVEILDKRDVLLESFKRYIDVKKLSYSQIRQALDKASISNISTFEKYNFWKDFTKAQYISLIKDEGGMILGFQALTGAMSGKRIRNIDDFKSATNSIENKEKEIAEMLVFGDIESGNNELKNMADNIKDGKSYDRSYIIKMAEENGVLKQLSQKEWSDLLKLCENSNEILKDISSYVTKFVDKKSPTYREFICLANIGIVNQNNLWQDLSPKDWKNLLVNSVKQTKKDNKLPSDFNNNVKIYFDNLKKSKALDKLSQEEIAEIVLMMSYVSRFDILKEYGLADKILPSGVITISRLGGDTLSKDKYQKLIEIIKIDKWTIGDIEENISGLSYFGKFSSDVFSKVDINKLGKKSVLKLIGLYPRKFKDNYKGLSALTPMDILEMLEYSENESYKLEIIGIIQGLDVYSKLTYNDKKVLENSILFSFYYKKLNEKPNDENYKRELFNARLNVNNYKRTYDSTPKQAIVNIKCPKCNTENIYNEDCLHNWIITVESIAKSAEKKDVKHSRPAPKAKRTLQPSEKDDTKNRSIDFETFKKRESLNRKSILGF